MRVRRLPSPRWTYHPASARRTTKRASPPRWRTWPRTSKPRTDPGRRGPTRSGPDLRRLGAGNSLVPPVSVAPVDGGVPVGEQRRELLRLVGQAPPRGSAELAEDGQFQPA